MIPILPIHLPKAPSDEGAAELREAEGETTTNDLYQFKKKPLSAMERGFSFN